MKRQKNNLEKNISRLLKQAGDSDKPGKVFTDSLIEKALDKLKQPAAGHKREAKDRPMKVIKIFASAAAVIVICGVLFGLLTHNQWRTKRPIWKSTQIIPEKREQIEEQLHADSKFDLDMVVVKDNSSLRSLDAEFSKEADKVKVITSTPEPGKPATELLGDIDKVRALAKAESAEKLDSLSEKKASQQQREIMEKAMVRTFDSISNVSGALTAGKAGKDSTGSKEQQSIPMLGDRGMRGGGMRGGGMMGGAGGMGGGMMGRGMAGGEYGGMARNDSMRGSRRYRRAMIDRSQQMKQRRENQLYSLYHWKPPEEAEPRKYPMAHGGTVPPNGEVVDAMFFKNYGVNPFIDTEDDHLSTFATDVDTGSYTIVRGYLHDGHLPPEDAVRLEEFVNYFNYRYAPPQEDDFAIYAEATPWKFGTGRKNSYLLRLGLKGKQITDENRRPAILTFVIDVSGSMDRENRLGLVKKSLRMLIERLKSDDKIGIAVYGSRGRKVMDHRGLDEKYEILAAIKSLGAGGSTYAEEGIRIGYEMAERAYRQGYINRVILCSDGVANVGNTGAEQILEIIKRKAEKGITLSAIGFGMGNYNDVLLEQLGDKGNGYYTYVDTISQAKRIFDDNLTGTLQVIARDVKVQVDFNPEVVRSYRLLGYENRDVPDDKFRDDKYDGGEVGAGHSVTALYELKLWPEKEGTVATTYVRYKDAQTSAVTEFKSSIDLQDFKESFEDTNTDFKLAATAAEFAEILRKSYWAKGTTLADTLKHSKVVLKQRENDADITELVNMITKAKQLMEKEEKVPEEKEENLEDQMSEEESEELIYLER
ncbi:von Willebrand factor type A domain-containing protein [Planctomycetota bacterium]